MLICTKNVAHDGSLNGVEFKEAKTVYLQHSRDVFTGSKNELLVDSFDTMPLVDYMEVAIYGGGVLVAIFKKGECVYLAQDQQFPILEMKDEPR